ncbi:MAG: 2OG-Fe(II) oxygenase [Pseudomonadota bacterium]|nr:2OG-Fe(II) oxygenase [Pseudomonadota bacterium]
MTIRTFDWEAVRAGLDARGHAILPGLLPTATCAELSDLYDDRDRFRSRVVMRRHGYGEGEYKYFAYPLPEPVQHLRTMLYPELAPLAAHWAERLGDQTTYPPTHADYLAACHDAGQLRPTPLVLRYGPGDYNRLHQDLYGAIYFPIQLVVMLSDPRDYEGGEFVLTETRPRMQTRAEVLTLGQGDGLLFAVNRRPVVAKRGYSAVAIRHGVSTIRSGHRTTLGVIFHDAI